MVDEKGVFRPRWFWFVEWTSDSEAVYRAARALLAEERTPFQEVAVFDSFELGKVLVIDGKVQSSLFDEHVYHESLVHPPMVLHGGPERVLILGGGEGATLREVLKYRSVREVVMVDIDEKVIEFARKHLVEWHQGSFDDPRVKLVIGDGRGFLEEEARGGSGYDVVILDLVDPLEGGPAVRLYTREFYLLVKRVLRENGVMVTQATSHAFYPRVFATIYKTIESVFGGALAYSACVRSFNGPWSFVLASNTGSVESLGVEEVDARLKRLIGDPSVLRYYDGVTHQGLLSLPRDVRRLLREHSIISTDEDPQYLLF